MANPDDALVIGGISVLPGTRHKIDIPLATLYDCTKMAISVEVIRGKEPGPVLFVSGAIHGDEINGSETIKRVLQKKRMLASLRGTLIAAPIVNVFGYNRNIRYLPDRRDLNRCFPGSKNGSLAGRIAHAFMQEIVSKSTHGIDLHTAAIHRTNLPQVRACLSHKETKRLALDFGVPVVVNANIRDGSLRQAALDLGIPMLLFEGGEALRYDEKAIRSALQGIFAVMQSIGMLSGKKVSKSQQKEVFVARSSHWIRAPQSGSLRAKKQVGKHVKKGDLLGVISNPFGDDKTEVRSHKTGIIIGMVVLPLVTSGDALFHIATFKDSQEVADRVDMYEEIL